MSEAAHPKHLLSTIRYDKHIIIIATEQQQPYLLLPYHRDRLLTAATAFKWDQAVRLLESKDAMDAITRALDAAVHEYEQNTGTKHEQLRIRLLISQCGEITVEVFPTAPIPSSQLLSNPPLSTDSYSSSSSSSHSPPMEVHLDPSPTPITPLTQFKTTSRDHYLESRSRAGLGLSFALPSEVVLHNPDGEMTECSFSNIAFWRNGGWVTPREASGGLPGVMRRWLLERDVWREGTVRLDEVTRGERVLLSNALRGVFVGVIV